MTPSPRTRRLVIVGASAAVVVLGLANLVRAGWLTPRVLSENQGVLSAANSLVSLCAVTVGGVLAYLRFFRGRTLAVRGEVAISVTTLAAPGGSSLHAITLHFKNVGTVAIWDPTPRIALYTHGDTGYRADGIIDSWYDPLEARDGRERTAVLDSGETSVFFTHQTFPPDVWAVTYIATVTCETGDIWKCATTMACRRSAESSQPAMPAPRGVVAGE